MKDINVNTLSKDKFRLAVVDKDIHDKKLDTKPISYFKDALLRFRKNKGSVVAFFIILFLFLYAIIVPLFSPFAVDTREDNFRKMLPRSRLSIALGWDFWDGCKVYNSMTEGQTQYYFAMGVEAGEIHSAIKGQELGTPTLDATNANRYNLRLDSYHMEGMMFQTLTPSEYIQLQAYQDENNIQVIYPMTEETLRPYIFMGSTRTPCTSANYWYKFLDENGETIPNDSYWQPSVLAAGEYPLADLTDPDDFNSLQNIYVPYYQVERYAKSEVEGFDAYKLGPYKANADGTWQYRVDATGEYIPCNDMYTSKMRIEANDEDGELYKYCYATSNQSGYEVRINRYEYYIYQHTTANNGAGDGITEPSFFFGTNNQGQDIFTCLASGALFSFMLAIFVSVINLTIGSIYGAIEGYYGGVVDLAMERFSDILSCVPFMIVLTLFKMHIAEDVGMVGCLLFAYVLTGWIGMAARVRMQFYRFKNQEYVLAARTLGAGDGRIMFKHIFPNSLGTLITGCVLVIPGVIFSESSLAYLGIINLSAGNITSVGSLLSEGQPFLMTYPHMILFPSIFISLLMLSFNLFGNGLRDAFNPSLRGAEG